MILDEIAAKTRLRIARDKAACPPQTMRQKADAAAGNAGFPFEAALRQPGLSFICEVKKASPSKGVISAEFPYLEIAKAYDAAGASAISVLTEPDFFLGADRYLTEIKNAVSRPVLRKDFILEAYQIDQARVIGADAVLLICALHTEQTLASLIRHAHDRGLSALVEAHTPEEVKQALDAGARIIGVNNRDLKTFSVDVSASARLRSLVPREILFVSESGVKTPQDVKRLKEIGADAVLIGETLMKSPDKTAALAALRGE